MFIYTQKQGTSHFHFHPNVPKQTVGIAHISTLQIYYKLQNCGYKPPPSRLTTSPQSDLAQLGLQSSMVPVLSAATISAAAPVC